MLYVCDSFIISTRSETVTWRRLKFYEKKQTKKQIMANYNFLLGGGGVSHNIAIR